MALLAITGAAASALMRAPAARMSADASVSRKALWKPGEVAPAHLTGDLAGDAGFDPLLLTALAKKGEKLPFELKSSASPVSHARSAASQSFPTCSRADFPT